MSTDLLTSPLKEKRKRRTKAETAQLRETVIEVLTEHNPMTVRQVYYQLVSRQLIDNNRSQYQGISNLLVDMRRDGKIDWSWIEDRLRKPRTPLMFNDIQHRMSTAINWYRSNPWKTQPQYVEAWLEKDALSGIFEDALDYYGITLNVGRGYDGWDSIHNAAQRYLQIDKPITILYFGDLDPSGEDMARSLKERLATFYIYPDIIKCALTFDDVQRYDLPPDFAKSTDTRAPKFIEKFGDISVELDALQIDVLKNRIVEEVEKLVDLDALKAVLTKDEKDREKLRKFVKRMK